MTIPRRRRHLRKGRSRTPKPYAMRPVTEKDVPLFSGEMWSYLLVNALRCLTEEQRAGLCFDLYCRNAMTETIDKKIDQLKQERSVKPPVQRSEDNGAHHDAVWIDESHQIAEPKESEGFKISLQIEDSENSLWDHLNNSVIKKQFSEINKAIIMGRFYPRK